MPSYPVGGIILLVIAIVLQLISLLVYPRARLSKILGYGLIAIFVVGIITNVLALLL